MTTFKLFNEDSIDMDGTNYCIFVYIGGGDGTIAETIAENQKFISENNLDIKFVNLPDDVESGWPEFELQSSKEEDLAAYIKHYEYEDYLIEE